MRDEHRQFLDDLVVSQALGDLVKQKEREIELGLTLFDLRTAAGMTQQALASLSGLQQSQISRWESEGIPTSTQMDTLLRAFGALGADLTLHFQPAQPAQVKVKVKNALSEGTELRSLRNALAKAIDGKTSRTTLSLQNGKKVIVQLAAASQADSERVLGTVVSRPAKSPSSAT
jgi:transcriptional regulator with XRE-family HTH domain